MIDAILESLGDVISGELTDKEGHLSIVDAPRRTQIDYYQPPGSTNFQPRYMAVASQGTTDGQAEWIIKRFTWTVFGTEDKVTDIQILKGSWNNRASLGWT